MRNIAVIALFACTWRLHQCAETSELAKQRSLPMCASGLRPWMESSSRAQSCGRPTDVPCPSGYVCEPRGNVCCPAPADTDGDGDGGHGTTPAPQPPATRPATEAGTPAATSTPSRAEERALCGGDGKLFRDGTGAKQSCDADSDCLPPSICKSAGYCCLLRLDQEPPPVGCPFGTRPLKNAQGQEVSCSPTQAASCPGDTMCYQDSLTATYHCCGKDPGEGCPSGSRAVKAAGKVVTCTPGSAAQSCSGKALCQWSYIIDRYQCCEADNGCPDGFAPLLSAPSGTVRSCKVSADGSHDCPANYGCEFNFWSASHQCCGRDLGQCVTRGQVPYLEAQTGAARQCTLGVASACPVGYVCSQTTTGQSMCCGTAGSCPAQFTTVLDTAGRPQACIQRAAVGSASGCKSPATCQPAVGGATGQHLCCASGTGQGSVQCAISGHTPYPSGVAPQYCNINVPNCAAGSVCEPSNVAGAYVCCQPGGQSTQACPNGWTLTNNVQQFCNPASTSCPPGGTCLASTKVPNQFICCTPSGTTGTQYVCPQGTPVKAATGGNQFCAGIGASCPLATGSLATCQQAVNAAGTFICCYAQQSQNYICPNNGSPYKIGNQYQYCTLTASNCAPPYTCQTAINVPSVTICCTGGGTSTGSYRCRGNGTPALTALNQNAFCNVNAANICTQGATCQSSLESASVSICCYGNQASNVRCADGSQPYAIGGAGVQYCSPFGGGSTCAAGYLCQQALGTTGTYVCCRSTVTSTPSPTAYTCPSGFRPYVLSGSSTLTFCNRQNPSNCPAGTTCMQATNAPQYSICCTSNTGASLCPAGQQALLGTNQQPVFCNSPADYCSSTGYSCQVSPTLSRYICCGSGTSALAQCRNGRPSYVLPGTSIAQQCNPSSPSSGCPAGYSCSASTIGTQYICCQGTTGGTTPAACANSAHAPYKPAGQVIQCTIGAYRGVCPTGTVCEASNVPNVAICCNSGIYTNAKCPIGWQGYQLGANIQRCSSLSDTSCPTGYSCTQSTVQGTFLCCRYGSSGGALQCYNGARVYTFPSSSQPMTCQQTAANTCPAGYACQPSTRPNISVCCSGGGTGGQFTCRSSGRPAYTVGGQTRFCAAAGTAANCPNGYTCDYSNINNVLVCCAAGTSSSVCPAGGRPYMQGTVPMSCSPTFNTCPTGYTCARNALGQYFCCESPRCASGTANPRQCTAGLLNQCAAGQSCVQSANVAGTYVCCAASTAGGARCVGRDTKLQAGTTAPVTCQPNGYAAQCGAGYECSAFTTNGQYVCCAAAGTSNPVCPNNREAYRNPDTSDYHYCDNTHYDCPAGYVCKKMINTSIVDRYVCCSVLPSCQDGWLPYIEPSTRQAKRCSPTELTRACSPTPGWPYKCQQSTVPGTYLCCMESAKSKVKLDGPSDDGNDAGADNDGDDDKKTDGSWWSWPDNDDGDKPAGTVDLSQTDNGSEEGEPKQSGGTKASGEWVVWGADGKH